MKIKLWKWAVMRSTRSRIRNEMDFGEAGCDEAPPVAEIAAMY